MARRLALAAWMLFVPFAGAAEPVPPKALLGRLQSKSEVQRVAAIPKIVWKQGADAEFLAALTDVIDTGLDRTPPLESTLCAVRKLGELHDPAADELLVRCFQASD